MKKCVIYTCIIGAYDDLLQPAVTDQDFDFVCFVGKGEKTAERIGVWEIREFDCGLEDRRLVSRYPKMHPHVLLPEYESSVWIDGNVQILDGTIFEAARARMADGSVYAGVRHPSRDCLYAEAWMCRKMGRLNMAEYLRVCAFLVFHGQKLHGGLIENNLIFRIHNDPRIVRLDELWWSMLFRVARRDQLSFPWCLHECGVPFVPFLPDGMNTRNHPA